MGACTHIHVFFVVVVAHLCTYLGGVRRFEYIGCYTQLEAWVSCLQTILANAKSLKGKISVIIGTEKTLESLAKKAKIPFVLIEDRVQDKAENKIIDICKKYNIDLISLARYMRILSPNFVWRYPNRIINIHPSLLPSFPGASAYAQAFERGRSIHAKL